MSDTDKTPVDQKMAELPTGTSVAQFRSRDQRIAAGKALRDSVPRQSHASWEPPANRRHPVELLKESNQDRLAELVPIRYGRMLPSPFTFLRGSAGLMASDLAGTPTTGLRVQACGDCHLLNFGLFATPERNLIFDINDFDETLPAPWEWDVKRLAVSFAVAVRDINLGEKRAQAAAIECVRAYRERLREFSKMSPLDVWYDRLDAQTIIDMAPDAKIREIREDVVAKAKHRISDYLYPQISEEIAGRRRLIDQPPAMFHVNQEQEPEHETLVREALEQYRLSLPDERRVLFDRYSLEDVVIKAVGIGSVGTFCFVGLFFSAENHPLLLQFKQACASVLEPYAGKSQYENHGQRVVVGQRLIQSASDIFLGWTSFAGMHFYVRQFKDMKVIPESAGIAPVLVEFATACGEVLARAHARSGDPIAISSYLAQGDTFSRAMVSFAAAYADQTERDHAELVAAIADGRLEAEPGW